MGNIVEIKVRPKGIELNPALPVTVYRFEGITVEEAMRLSTLALTDPITQESSVNPDSQAAPQAGEQRVEIGLKPGVTDPIEASLLKVCSLFGIQPVAVASSVEVKAGTREPSQIETIVQQKPDTLVFSGSPEPARTLAVRDLSADDLIALSRERSLFLSLEEMRVIQKHYVALGRDPKDIELETFAQTWSEHCAHKTFKALLIAEDGQEIRPLFERIKRTSERYFRRAGVVTAFKDNAGGILFYDGQVIIGKGETHNSPVAIDPYGGALTKNGGVFRDIAGCGQGGINLVSFMINNFAPPDMAAVKIPAGCLSPKFLLLDNSRGERNYGNPMGIPTHGVALHFHPDFVPKPTSLGVAIGLIPVDRVEKGQPQPGDLIVTVGGKTGRDGIHGATFSSGEMDASTQRIHVTAVQLGDPIVEKAMFDALIACRDADLIRAITDCGAGGYASAIGEIAQDTGAQVFLERIPQKYSGLAAWERWLSESQERMIVAVSPDRIAAFEHICHRYDTPVHVIGCFTADHQLTIFDQDERVAQIDLDFLHHGLPQRRMEMSARPYPQEAGEPDIPPDLLQACKAVLSHLAVCSKEALHRMYDQSVQAMTVLAPFTGVYQDAPNDASILSPLAGRPYGLVTAHAVNPILNRYDPYWGSMWAFAQAATRYAAAGGDIRQAAGIDNFVWPYPDKESLADLDTSVNAVCRMVDLLELPLVSGKDSLSSTYRSPDGTIIKAPPSLNMTIFGRIPDVQKTVSCDFKRTGSTICLVGKLDFNRMGGSAYFDTRGIANSDVPRVDAEHLPRVLHATTAAISDGSILSARAIGEGGLATALAIMCFGGDCGAEVDIAGLGARRPDYTLFNETAGCLLVEVADSRVADAIFRDVPYCVIGRTTAEKEISIYNSHKPLMTASLYDLKAAWQRPIKDLLSDG